MKQKIINNPAAFIFTIFILIGAAYGVYSLVWGGPTQAAKDVNNNLILACEKNKARSQIFQDFAYEAAAARRRNAEKDASLGDKVGAANEIATAKKYEGFAIRWDKLTVHDCQAEYPTP